MLGVSGALPAVFPIASSPVSIELCAWISITALFLLSYGSLAGLALIARCLNPLLLLPGALPYALAFAWNLRESTGHPTTRFLLLAVAAFAAVFLALALRSRGDRSQLRRATGVTVAMSLLAAALAMALYWKSNYIRWVMLRYVPALGVPLNWALDEPAAERAEEFRRPVQTLVRSADTADRAAARQAPNLILILVDTLRADVFSRWGAQPSPMPRVDQWASDALAFTDVLANSSWTRPSVASIFTGLTPEEHGARDRHEALSESHETLAERLKAADYFTAAVVANHGAVGSAVGFAQGFDVFVEPDQKPYARAAEVATSVSSVVSGRDDSRPLFLYVHFLDPHEPYLAGVLPRSHLPRDAKPAYRAELGYLDEVLSPMLAALSASLGENTWIALTSDHGEEFGEHGSGGHGHTLYRELVHIPFLLYGPTAKSSAVADPLEARDFFSLLLELATGGKDPVRWAKRSRRVYRYSSLDFSSPWAAQLRRRYTVARRLDTQDFTLIWSAYGSTLEVYDPRTDPNERSSLASALRDRIPVLVATMKESLPDWSPSTDIEDPEATEEQLRALGYL